MLKNYVIVDILSVAITIAHAENRGKDVVNDAIVRHAKIRLIVNIKIRIQRKKRKEIIRMLKKVIIIIVIIITNLSMKKINFY